MNKILLLFFSTLLFSQEKIKTNLIDFNKTGNGYPKEITITDNQKYILANLKDSIPMIFKFDASNQNLDFLYNNPAYISYSARNLYSLKDKILFHNYNYPHYLTSFDGENFKHIAEFPKNNLFNFIKNKNGYFFLNKDPYYANKFYYTDGKSLTEAYFGGHSGNKYQLEFVDEKELIYSFTNKDTIFLSKYDLTQKKSKIIARNFIRNDVQKNVSIFNDKILFSLSEKDSNYIYYNTFSLDSITKLSLVKPINDYISDTIPVKTTNEFISFQSNNNLYFSGNIKNNHPKLFKLSSDNKLEMQADLLINNQYYILTKNSKYFQYNNKMYFTAFENDLDLTGSLWVLDNDKNSISLLKSNFTQPIHNFYVVNNKLYYQDKSSIYKINLSNLDVSKLTEVFSEITYSDLVDEIIYFSATDAIHGNELYTLNPKDDTILFFKEFNYQANTNVSQLLQSNDGIYFISDSKMYLFNGDSFKAVSESSPLLISSAYNKKPEHFREVAEFNDKLIFISLDKKLISFNKKLNTVTDLGYVDFDGNAYNFNKRFLQVDNKLYFSGLNSDGYPGLKVTDGTLDGTYFIQESNSLYYSPNSLTYNKNDDRVYFVGPNNYGKSIYSTKGIKNDFVEEYNFGASNLTSILGAYKDFLIVETYEQNGLSVYLLKNKQLTNKLPIILANHYVSSFYNDDDKMYFLYNNRFVESDGTTTGTKEIFQSNYERLFNLVKCGSSFYFEDEKQKQIFRTTGNKTQLIKKFDGDHTLTSSTCYNNTMFYTNNDTYEPNTYNVRKNYLIISNDQKSQDVEIDHILNHKYSRSSTTISEIEIYNDKLLLKYFNGWIDDQSLLMSDIKPFTLSTEDIKVQISNGHKIIVYPNPIKNILNIKATDKSKILEVEIYNTLGQIVSTIKKSGSQIDLSTLKKGIYFIRITTNNNIETKKIIKH
ncbi:T9SS type A sorting domain-containing protein [Empedobacter brevis]|uniref:T9SS type A sorting domain-containing protein n=1 Tax=Empedobacter brevis TaxID=247 RepID=UPI002898998D|nr:T9SS type A sorting domain-containing protein [Empedobacter brevis]